MKDIAIYGAGGFGREIYCLIQRINAVNPTWNVIGFFDDGKEIGSSNEYGPVLGGINELNAWITPLDVAISIGNPKYLEQISSKIINNNISFPNIIAPDTIFLDKESVSMGIGNIICTGCLISCNTHFGNFNVFNGLITIGHDATMGNYNSLMPAVRISGEVIIGDCNFFGVSSVVLQQIKIGNHVVIGANSTVIRKPKDGNTYVGNPATIVKY